MSSNTVSTLETLIATCKDGEEGFRMAADEAKAPDLKALCMEYSRQRSSFAAELQSHARSQGEPNPTDSGSAAAALHRTWMKVRDAVSSRDDHAVMAECERGEDSAVAAYRKAMEDKELPSGVMSVIAAQYDKVKSAHDRVRAARNALASSNA